MCPARPGVSLTWEQLREIAALPGFGLGAHTLTHPDLPNRSPEEARAEMAGGADRLRERVGVEVEQFAYPFGAWNQSVARLVGDLGFRAAYTTDGNAISWSSSPHALPRVPAEGHAPGDFARMLTGLWVADHAPARPGSGPPGMHADPVRSTRQSYRPPYIRDARPRLPCDPIWLAVGSRIAAPFPREEPRRRFAARHLVRRSG